LAKKFKKKKEKPKIEEKDSSEIKTHQGVNNPVSWIVFLFTISIVLISLISVVFPALMARSMSEFQDFEINPFETGIWSGPLVAANIILLGIGLLYFKGKLPQSITRSIKFIFNFEVSRKVAFTTIAVLLIPYVALSANELATEESFSDYPVMKNSLEGWRVEHITQNSQPHLKYILLFISMEVFGSYRVIPFFASVALLVLVYFITVEISQKRFAGIVSMILVLQSSTFLTYDTSSTYSNFWILLYVLSLYLIYKAWPLSALSYFLSIPTKALTILFWPMSLFFIYRSRIPRKKKISLFIIYIAIAVVGFTILVSFPGTLALSGVLTEFDSNDFWRGFTSMSPQLRFDGILLMFLLPLVVGLFLLSRRGVLQADSVMVLILGMLLIPAILAGFSDQTNQPYRFVPLIVFFSIGVGTILSKVREKV